MSGECGTDGRTDASDLVLHLYGLDTQVTPLGQLMQDVGSRGNGIRSEEKRPTAHLGCHNQSPSRSLVAADVGISARAHVVALDAVGRNRGMDVVAIVVTTLDHQFVGGIYIRFLGEFGL